MMKNTADSYVQQPTGHTKQPSLGDWGGCARSAQQQQEEEL